MFEVAFRLGVTPVGIINKWREFVGVVRGSEHLPSLTVAGFILPLPN